MNDPETWLDAHGDALYAFAMRRVRDPHLAEELVQDALLTGIERRDSFEGGSSMRTWLCGILRNKILQHRRRQQRGGGTVPLEVSERLVDAAFTWSGRWRYVPEPWPGDPADGPEHREMLEALQRCLDGLPERSAEALRLVEQDGLATDAACKVLGLSRTNLYVVLHRARFALRTCVERRVLRSDSRT